MKLSELRVLVEQIATGLDIPVDSPHLASQLLDRIGNLRHQEQHSRVLNHCLEKNRALNAQNAELQMSLLRKPQGATADTAAHPLFHVFNCCVQRSLQDDHGTASSKPCPFWQQSWVELADHYGAGFLYAQAAQKLREAQLVATAEAAAKKRIEAINHIAKGLLYERQRQLPEELP